MKTSTLTAARKFVLCDYFSDAAHFPTREDALNAAKLVNRCYDARPYALTSGQFVLRAFNGLFLRVSAV